MSAHVAIGATAVVCCVHDQPKRHVTELPYDAAHTSVHLCACCENLFLEPSDYPMFCKPCRRQPLHQLGGPLPDPKGRI